MSTSFHGLRNHHDDRCVMQKMIEGSFNPELQKNKKNIAWLAIWQRQSQLIDNNRLEFLLGEERK